MSRMMLALAGILMIGVTAGLAARNDEKEQDDAQVVAMDKLPAAARNALSKLAGDAKILEVTMEDEDGMKVFEGSWKVEDVDHEASVTEHGDVVETEQAISLEAAPEAVQRAARRALPEGTEFKVEKKTIVLYEVEAKINGEEKETLVSPTGQRLEIEQEDHEDEDDEER